MLVVQSHRNHPILQSHHAASQFHSSRARVKRPEVALHGGHGDPTGDIAQRVVIGTSLDEVFAWRTLAVGVDMADVRW